jgi:hypothetical protein
MTSENVKEWFGSKSGGGVMAGQFIGTEHFLSGLPVSADVDLRSFFQNFVLKKVANLRRKREKAVLEKVLILIIGIFEVLEVLL